MKKIKRANKGRSVKSRGIPLMFESNNGQFRQKNRLIYVKGKGRILNKKIPLYTVTWEEKTKNYYPYNSEKDGNQFYEKEQAERYVKKLQTEKTVRKPSIKMHVDMIKMRDI